jgi:hypothetical protein
MIGPLPSHDRPKCTRILERRLGNESREFLVAMRFRDRNVWVDVGALLPRYLGALFRVTDLYG